MFGCRSTISGIGNGGFRISSARPSTTGTATTCAGAGCTWTCPAGAWQPIPWASSQRRVVRQPDEESRGTRTMINQEILDLLRVQPGKKFRLKDHDPGWAQSPELEEAGKGAVKERARAILEKNLAELTEAQELLYADGR